mgnify:FL=1|tara:strand:- start:310 stop:1938 length:1629 start_codon:yes stop_codon:yes gene_type:complete
MLFGLITLFTALAIAGVAAWFSIEGLMAIFSASAVPIAIMAGTLEIGKLLTASWLYRYWHETTLLLKTYLSIAVVVLMLVTSMGIFGYLSKAHLDQAGVSSNAFATVERIDGQIAREENKIDIIEDRILSLGGSTDVSNSIAQQEEIRDGAWARVQGDIDYNQEQIENVRAQLKEDIAQLDSRLAALDKSVNDLRAKGVEVVTLDEGGAFRQAETEKIDYVAQANELFASQKAERDTIKEEKNTLRQTASADIKVFQDAIDNYRAQAQKTIDDANAEINRLRNQSTDQQDTNLQKIDEYNTEIDNLYDNIAILKDEKFEAESIVRDLETEVGPIKYVAELIYGGDSQDYLDQAVRLFILMLVFVFDPLAVVLIIAANQTLLRYGINLEKTGPEGDGNGSKQHYTNSEYSDDLGKVSEPTGSIIEAGSLQNSESRNYSTSDDLHLRQSGKDGDELRDTSGPTSVEYFDRDEMPSAVDDAAVAMAEAAANQAKIKELEKQLEEKPKEIIVEKEVEKELNIDLNPPKAILDLEKKLKQRLDKDGD